MSDYYLTDKQINYAVDMNGKSARGGWCKGATINPTIAHAITCRSAAGQQRCGVSNFVCSNLPLNFPVEKYKKMWRRVHETSDSDREHNSDKETE